MRFCPRCGQVMQTLENSKAALLPKADEMRAKLRGEKQWIIAGRMKITGPYLSDLLNGNRRWTPDLERRFNEALLA